MHNLLTAHYMYICFDDRNQLSYSEVNCTGPGATQAGRVSWMKNLSPNELEGLVNMSFIDQEGWLENQPSL